MTLEHIIAGIILVIGVVNIAGMIIPWYLEDKRLERRIKILEKEIEESNRQGKTHIYSDII